MRKKLSKLYQNEKTVNAYAYELEQLFGMIGSTDEWEKVIKLWYDLWPTIQETLWQDGLNPEVSTWSKVLTQAIIIEILKGVSEGHQGGTISFNARDSPWNGPEGPSKQRTHSGHNRHPATSTQQQPSNPREHRWSTLHHNRSQRPDTHPQFNEQWSNFNNANTHWGSRPPQPQRSSSRPEPQGNMPRLSEKERESRKAGKWPTLPLWQQGLYGQKLPNCKHHSVQWLKATWTKHLQPWTCWYGLRSAGRGTWQPTSRHDSVWKEHGGIHLPISMDGPNLSHISWVNKRLLLYGSVRHTEWMNPLLRG